MAYHVEVRRSLQRARAFNLDEAELRQTLLEPWAAGRPVQLGDREWARRDAQLRILQGPSLAAAELAHGQGWGRAERTAQDVTEALLAEAARVQAVAVLAPDASVHEAVARLLVRLELRVSAWAPLREPVVAWVAGGSAAESPVDAVVLACVREPPAWWLLDAGLAFGAFGPRALAVQCDGGPPPPELAGLEVLQLGGGPDAPLAELAARLRRVVR